MAHPSKIVMLLIKKSSMYKDDLGNDMPVSGLHFLSRLIEHVLPVKSGFRWTLMILAILCQSAYNAGHSTGLLASVPPFMPLAMLGTCHWKFEFAAIISCFKVIFVQEVFPSLFLNY